MSKTERGTKTNTAQLPLFAGPLGGVAPTSHWTRGNDREDYLAIAREEARLDPWELPARCESE